MVLSQDKKDNVTPDLSQVRLLSQRAFKTCDSFWQMSAGLLLPTSPFAWGMTPTENHREWHTDRDLNDSV